VDRLSAQVVEMPPVRGDVRVDGGAVPVGLPADRGPLGQQPVLVAEVGQQPAGIGGAAAIR